MDLKSGQEVTLSDTPFIGIAVSDEWIDRISKEASAQHEYRGSWVHRLIEKTLGPVAAIAGAAEVESQRDLACWSKTLSEWFAAENVQRSGETSPLFLTCQCGRRKVFRSSRRSLGGTSRTGCAPMRS